LNTMVRVSGMALYGSVAASTRYRMSQFVPGLSQLGIEVDIQPLLDDAYLQARYQGRAVPVGSLLRSGVSRIRALRKPDACDVLMVYGELFPLMPACLEQSLMRQPFIYDFDDAFYLKYQSGRMRLLRPVLGRKFEQVIAAAAAVTAGLCRAVQCQCAHLAHRGGHRALFAAAPSPQWGWGVYGGLDWLAFHSTLLGQPRPAAAPAGA
jgi:hypothetical protein